MLPSFKSLVHDPTLIDALKPFTTKTKSKIEIRRVPVDHVPLQIVITTESNIIPVDEAPSNVTQMQYIQESPNMLYSKMKQCR